eukprot:scaffold1776_cov106-Cylindrotheca_fusiformis.AAC.8
MVPRKAYFMPFTLVQTVATNRMGRPWAELVQQETAQDSFEYLASRGIFSPKLSRNTTSRRKYILASITMI